MSTISKLISAKAVINKESDKLVLNDVCGTDRIKKFLKHCENKTKTYTVGEYPYLIKYAIRYTLVKEDGEILCLDTYGIKLLNCLVEPELDEIKVSSLLKDILGKNREGCGCWVVTEDIIMGEQFYVFEAKGENDAAYEYALFLYDLGIIEAFGSWKRHEDGLYFCKRTNLGQELLRIIKIDFFQSHSNQYFEDNSISNSGIMAGGVTAGKKNNGKQ